MTEERAFLLGGPYNAQIVGIAPGSVDTMRSPEGGVYKRAVPFLFEGPEPQVNRWTKKKRPNPFTKPRR